MSSHDETNGPHEESLGYDVREHAYQGTFRRWFPLRRYFQYAPVRPEEATEQTDTLSEAETATETATETPTTQRYSSRGAISGEVPLPPPAATVNTRDADQNRPVEDNPLLLQMLFFVGLIAQLPIFWIIGTVILLGTASDLTATRKWGAINALMLIIYLIYSISTSTGPVKKTPIPIHNPQAASFHLSGGEIYDLSDKDANINQLIWDFNHASSIENWTYMTKNNEIDYSIVPISNFDKSTIPNSATVLGPTSFPLQYPISSDTIYLSPTFLAKGRLSLITVIGAGSASSSLYQDNLKYCTDQFTLHDSVYTDEKLPSNFLGSCLRCTLFSDDLAANSEPPLWLFHWRNQTGMDPFMPTPCIFRLPNLYSCQVGLITTLPSKSSTHSDETSTESLPSLDNLLTLQWISIKALPD